MEKLPPAFKRYRKMLGALDFAVFEDAGSTEEDVLSAMSQALFDARHFDAERLRTLGCRRLRERSFFGEWYDLESGMLLKIGDYTTADGTQLHNPKLKELDRVKIMSGGAPVPEAGAGGEFAYAFSNSPYGLNGRPSEIQSVFEEVRDFILPPTHKGDICDWTSPKLPEVSDYFEAGMEWWGVFLFSIYIPAQQKLTIIAGSTSD
ncbi:MAG: hypothetical protein SFV20_00710 [Sphingopyxis sp.]|nr:hypothetical protein [Sphingopyxis sp.]